MSRLEQKLIELGYEFVDSCYNSHCYRKCIEGNGRVCINVCKDRIIGRYIDKVIIHQQDIDNLQQAFNEMQKDLKELRKYED